MYVYIYIRIYNIYHPASTSQRQRHPILPACARPCISCSMASVELATLSSCSLGSTWARIVCRCSVVTWRGGGFPSENAGGTWGKGEKPMKNPRKMGISWNFHGVDENSMVDGESQWDIHLVKIYPATFEDEYDSMGFNHSKLAHGFATALKSGGGTCNILHLKVSIRIDKPWSNLDLGCVGYIYICIYIYISYTIIYTPLYTTSDKYIRNTSDIHDFDHGRHLESSPLAKKR